MTDQSVMDRRSRLLHGSGGMEGAAVTRRLRFLRFTRWVLPEARRAGLKMPLGLPGGGMFRRLCWAGALWLLSELWGCSAPNPNVRVRRLENKLLEVDGPLAGPFKTLEELAQNACELMTSQPGACSGRYGFEYCPLH
jgi:hypothetical protein